MTKLDAMEIDIIRCEVKRRTPLIALISDNINKADQLQLGIAVDLATAVKSHSPRT